MAPLDRIQRAEKLIVEIWRQRTALVEQAKQPRRVVVSPDEYRLIQSYRARLGTLDDAEMDYLGRYEIFGLEICVEADHAVEVQAAAEEQ